MVFVLSPYEDEELAITAETEEEARTIAYEHSNMDGEKDECWLTCPCRVIEKGVVFERRDAYYAATY
jgi:hypothetical protein